MQINTVIPCIFNQIRPGSTFLSINSYTNNYGEVANYSVVFGFNYLKAVEKALNIWAEYVPVNSTQKLAKQDLMTSYRDTLHTGYNHRARSAHAYSQVKDCNGCVINGVKLHLREKALHLTGLIISKKVLVPCTYPSDTRGSFTLERDRLIQKTPLVNFRQFKLVEGRFDTISVQKLTLTQQDLIKKFGV